ncbi:maleylpyruvate isomerase family mycothiol-dependent enzyme [Arsenicicoccus sp. MKL-02]|uniref:Maleylpyruvate isomerase family mycothiol-dependent enzyme n=1 Tax=Arsenicicoccus cauae TaxID=2663847 RepID=A0A6I3IUN8_9MICO|nr:maleylpyruvate isomerase family mycothiol-dependent enzyme [Arsenicicoccus cauae]MTB70546.1 maleylpyruvate isomerase family mycothiol-dependent enzyme [Arsenicicoccus cauae]
MTDAPAQQHAADLALLRVESARVVATVEALGADGIRHPSMCEGWTRAHAISHLSGNARAMLNLVATVEGDPTPMYPSREERDTDIERGAAATYETLLAELRDTSQQLVDALAAMPESAMSRTAQAGNDPAAMTALTGADLPGHRLREVVWHHVDLDAGYTFADAPAKAVGRWFDEAVDDLRSDPRCPPMTLRTDERDVVAIGDGRPTVSGPRAGLLLWLVRGRPDQVTAPSPDQLPHLSPDQQEDLL